MSPSTKQVSFGDLTIQEYPIELGDHPSVSSGAPVCIGWLPLSVSTRSIESHERMRNNGQNKRRKGKKQLSIPVHTRGKLLLEAGYSIDEIACATLQADQIKKLRSDTIKNQGWDRANMVLETTGKLPNLLARVLLKPIRKSVQVARTA